MSSNNYIPIPILDRMCKILDYLDRHPTGITAKMLLADTAIPKTTVYRLLASMTQNGLLSYQNVTDCYTIGSRFVSSYISRDDQVRRLRKIARPSLKKLSALVGETVKLTILSDFEAYTVDTVEGSKTIRISVDPGAIFPLHAGASGKVLMSSLSQQDVYRYYQSGRGSRYTETTITDPDAMLAQLQQIEALGYAVDTGEYLPEIRAVSSPIRDPAGQVIAAVSIAYPSTAEGGINVPQLTANITQTAAAIGEDLNRETQHDMSARLIVEPSQAIRPPVATVAFDSDEKVRMS